MEDKYNNEPYREVAQPSANYSIKMEHSIDKLAEALSKAQMQLNPPLKKRKVDFTNKKGQRVKYNYADLADVIECLKKPFGDNGLSIAHILTYEEDDYGLVTKLMHSSGQYIETWYPLPDPRQVEFSQQEFGSALTYARRYSISSIAGIASEEDDDGAEAAPNKPKQKPPQQQNQRPPASKQDSQSPAPKQKPADQPHPPDTPPVTLLDQLYAIVEDRGITNDQMKENIRRATGELKKSTELTPEELQNVISYILLTHTNK